jgi:hypothetical protein
VRIDMATHHFDVFVQGTPGGSPDDWKRAKNAPESALPELSREQADIAKRMEIPEKEYARGVLAGTYAQERHTVRGEKLGKAVEKLLASLGSGFVLDAIIRDATEFRWVARITTPTAMRSVAIPLDLGDDVIDSPLPEVLEKLKQIVAESVGREDWLSKSRK